MMNLQAQGLRNSIAKRSVAREALFCWTACSNREALEKNWK